uniref:Uncharacterized protein n=1 Tax=Tanacetum cinerariifolium TaxID=118510 RepID=A0A699HM68_TANCI|nr:hypothetical protein [Tanacetum cinerariifolium]
MVDVFYTEMSSEGQALICLHKPKGTGVPARISRKMKKKKQTVILLDPERQYIRREGEVPIADFLWYSAARPCTRNYFDRDEIVRVMNAAGRRQDALPQVNEPNFQLQIRFFL